MLHPPNGKKSSIFGLQLGKEAHSPCFWGLKPSTRYEINSNFCILKFSRKTSVFLRGHDSISLREFSSAAPGKSSCWNFVGVSGFLGWQITKPKKNAMSSKENWTFWDSTSFKIHISQRPSRLKTLAKLKMTLKIELIYKSTGKTGFFSQPN